MDIDASSRQTDPDPTALRLTLRRVAYDSARHFFNLESGWLRTARELTISPGPMIRRYVEGHRSVYANPFGYLVIASAASFVVQKAAGFQDRMVTAAQGNTLSSPLQMEFVNTFTELLFQHMLFVSIGIVIPIALLVRVLFRGSGYNLAECSVFSLYAAGHTALFGIVLIPILMLLPPSGLIQASVSLGAAIPYMIWASRGFLVGRLLWVAAKMTVAYLMAYAAFMVAVVLFVIAYIVVVMQPSSSGVEWDLVTATDYEAIPVIEKLLDDGADVNMTRQLTSLHAAATSGNLEIVNLLLEHGADVNLQDIHGRTPLFVALAEHHPEVATRLAEEPTDVSVRAADGSTLLIAAVRAERVDLVRWALEQGTDVNAVRPEKKHATALIMAAAKGNPVIVQLLLAAGADPNLTNHKGQTALDLAKGREVRSLLQPVTTTEAPNGGKAEQVEQ
jgi:hypothetical protein